MVFSRSHCIHLDYRSVATATYELGLTMGWALKRTKQCKHCPWRVDVDPHDIPNGYCETKHANLESTIAADPVGSLHQTTAMACHETDDAHCVGWLMNQVGPGNNIGLRLRMMTCENSNEIRLVGEQHETFADTLPGSTERQELC